MERENQEALESRRSNLLRVIEDVNDKMKHIIKKAVTNKSTVSTSTNFSSTSIASSQAEMKSSQNSTKSESHRAQLQSRLMELYQGAIKSLQTTTFKDILMFEFESQKWFVKFQELLITIKQKQKQKNNNEALGNFMHLFRTPGGQTEQLSKNEVVPSKNGMLSFLINTKNLDKEMK